MRDRGHSVWADYYAGLSLQMLAVDILLAARALSAVDTLRSDREAALHHLDDVASMDTAAFFVPRTRETWFHGFARRGFGVTLLSVSHVIREEVGNEQLAVRLETLSGTYIRHRAIEQVWRVLWAFVTPETTVYAICPGRGFDFGDGWVSRNPV